MQTTQRKLLREMGVAFAMLAIYVLTLLLPLHQAAGLQRDLNALGYSTLQTWSVCQLMAEDNDADPASAAALTCPALGVAKHQLAGIVPSAPDVAPRALAELVRFSPANPALAATRPDHIGQSRAPPVPA